MRVSTVGCCPCVYVTSCVRHHASRLVDAVQTEREGLMSSASLSEFPPTQTAVLIPSTAGLPDQATQLTQQALANPGLIHLRRRLRLPLLHLTSQTSQQQQSQQLQQQQQPQHQPHEQQPQQHQQQPLSNSFDRTHQSGSAQDDSHVQSAQQDVATGQVQSPPARFQDCSVGVSHLTNVCLHIFDKCML